MTADGQRNRQPGKIGWIQHSYQMADEEDEYGHLIPGEYKNDIYPYCGNCGSFSLRDIGWRDVDTRQREVLHITLKFFYRKEIRHEIVIARVLQCKECGMEGIADHTKYSNYSSNDFLNRANYINGITPLGGLVFSMTAEDKARFLS